jgi:hypothetical protein
MRYSRFRTFLQYCIVYFCGISHSFCLFSIFFSYNTFIHTFAEGPLLFPHCTSLSRGPPWGAEPGFELGPAVQQADALLFELRRTLFELRRTLFELRRTLYCIVYLEYFQYFSACLAWAS